MSELTDLIRKELAPHRGKLVGLGLFLAGAAVASPLPMFHSDAAVAFTLNHKYQLVIATPSSDGGIATIGPFNSLASCVEAKEEADKPWLDENWTTTEKRTTWSSIDEKKANPTMEVNHRMTWRPAGKCFQVGM